MIIPYLLRSLTAAGPVAATLLAAGAGCATPAGLDLGQGTEVAPVGASQEGMFWHEQFAPGSFNLPPLVRRYEGALDVAGLEEAFHDLVARHAPLRTTFHVVGGQAVQAVGAGAKSRLAVVDLRDRDADGQKAEIARVVAEAIWRPFDLARGPLFEPRLYRLGDGDHVLVIRLHHLVFDDWSVDVFRRDLSALYFARVGSGPGLPMPALDFLEHCRRQRQVLEGVEGRRQLSYWRGELAGVPLALRLAIADPSRVAGSPHPPAGPLEQRLDAASIGRLRDLAQRHRTTLFMALLAVFAATAHVDSGQDDFLVSTVVANRQKLDAEDLIGCFTKKVLLRLRCSGESSLVDLLAGSRRSVLGAFANQDLAFEAVVQQVLGPAAAAHGLVPDASVVFQADTPHNARLALPGIRVGPFDTGAPGAQPHFAAGAGADDEEPGPVWGGGLYPRTFLIVTVIEAGGEVSLHARGAFHEPAVEALLRRFDALLHTLVNQPDVRLSDLVGHVLAGGSSGAASPPGTIDLDGFPVEPARMEQALHGCPGVREVAIALCGGVDRRRLVAYVVPADGVEPPTLVGLRAHLWSRLPGYAWPSAMVVVDALPRRGEGAPPPSPVEACRPPATPAERLLSDLWAEARGEAVDATANYWQQFSFLEVVRRARDLGHDLDGRVTRNRTIETLAADLTASAPP